MQKKYFPFIILIAAALFLFFIKKNQRGAFRREYPADNITPNTNEGFNRAATKIIYTRHALCRMDCRHIDESEVSEILQTGKINESKIEEDSRGKTYPLEGITHDKQLIRVVFAPKGDELVVVTVIDLDKDWDCNCK